MCPSRRRDILASYLAVEREYLTLGKFRDGKGFAELELLKISVIKNRGTRENLISW